MSRNTPRHGRTPEPTPTPEPSAVVDPEPSALVDPEPSADITPEPTPEPSADITPEPTPEPSADPDPEPSDPADDPDQDDPADDPDQDDDPEPSDDEKRATAVDALTVAWRDAASVSDNGALPSAADLEPINAAWRRVAALVTKPTERTALVATVAAELSAQFMSDNAVLPALAVHSIRGHLDTLTVGKTAVVIDQTRANATQYAAAAVIYWLTASGATDDERALAATIPADDPALVALCDRAYGALTKRGTRSGSGSTPTTASGPRKTAESLDTVLQAIPAGDTVALSAVAKTSGRSPGALTNAHAAMLAGTRVVAGVRAVIVDGKKSFTRDAA